MKRYELVIILSEQVTEKELPEVSKKIKEIIQAEKGKIESEEDLGRKKMAFQIKKNQFGTYLVFRFNNEPNELKTINSKIKLEPEVLRFMITSLPKKVEEVKKIKKLKEAKEEKAVKKTTKPAKKPEIVPVKKEKKAEITEEIESEDERMKKLEEELGKILEE
jgi:small subunit ribosomal protein S6